MQSYFRSLELPELEWLEKEMWLWWEEGKKTKRMEGIKILRILKIFPLHCMEIFLNFFLLSWRS